MFHYAAPVQQLDYSIPIQLETLESPRLGSERTRRKRRISLHLLLSRNRFAKGPTKRKFLVVGTGRGLAFLAAVPALGTGLYSVPREYSTRGTISLISVRRIFWPKK